MSTQTTGQAIPQVRELPVIKSMLDFQNRKLELFLRVLRECGDIGAFHIGPVRIVLLNSAAAVGEMLVERESEFGGTRVQDAFLPLMGPNSLIMLEGAEHRRHRKMHAGSFHPRKLVEFTKPMTAFTDDMVNPWRDGQELDLEQAMTRLTMRIVGKTLMDQELRETDELAIAFRTVGEYIIYLVTSLFPVPLSVPTPRNRRTRAALETVRSSVRRFIEEHRRSGKDQGDFLSSMLQARDEAGNPLSDDQLLDHMVTMFGAGHETVSAAMCWSWYLLMKHPDVYARVTEEVDRVLGGRTPTAADLPQLPYGNQVLREVLRLYPPSHLIARSPKQDTVLAGKYAVKKGEMVLVSPYTLHRNPAYFPEPERFDPSRFAPDNEKKYPRHSYLPFGAGPHVCIGNHYAMMEAQLILTRIVQRVKFELLPGQDIHAIPGAVLEPSELRVRVTLRPPLAAVEAPPAPVRLSV